MLPPNQSNTPATKMAKVSDIGEAISPRWFTLMFALVELSFKFLNFDLNTCSTTKAFIIRMPPNDSSKKDKTVLCSSWLRFDLRLNDFPNNAIEPAAKGNNIITYNVSVGLM